MTNSEEEPIMLQNLQSLHSIYDSPLEGLSEEATSALKRIKHTLIGHPQTKQQYIDHGIIPLLIWLLKNRDGVSEEVKVEASICIGSLAYGGEQFAPTLLDDGLLQPLISSLDPSKSNPRLILSSLRTLNTLFDTCSSDASSKSQAIVSAVAAEIYSRRDALVNINRIISQTSPSPMIQQQIFLAASLVAKTCGCIGHGAGEVASVNREKHQQLLVECGVLEALGKRLGGFIVRSKPVSTLDRLGETKITDASKPGGAGDRRVSATGKGPSTELGDDDKENTIPPPAPPTAKVAPILDAISVIIRDSHIRSFEFLYAPWVTAPLPPPSSSRSKRYTSQRKSSESAVASPSIITPSAFPPLSAASVSDMDVTPGATPYFSGEHSDAEESPPRILSSHDHQLGDEDVEQAPLILWLISRCRNSDALSRLMAISLLTNLFRVGLAGKKLVNLLVLLVLPILVRLLDEENPNNPQSEYHRGGAMVGGVVPSRKNEWIIRERAPAILADLVNDNEQMQKAAVDAGAVKKLAAMLKRTFEVPPSSSPGKETNGVLSLQNSERNSDRSADASHNASLKDDGNSPFKIHRMKVRESTLRCLAGLASCKDEYRKLVIEAGVVPYIVAALRPNKLASTIPEAFSSAGKEISDAPNIVKEGNPPRVLIAAAYAIKSLSRSVSVLRTSLADAGIPSPLFDLLKGEDIEVKIAGTMALCNLVLEFSPMRTLFMEMGILKLICEFAHSSNLALRLNSMWALKHLVYSAENEVKTSCLSQLGSGWLVDLISWDEDLDPVGHGHNSEDEDDGMDEDEATGPHSDDTSNYDESRMEDSIGQLSTPFYKNSKHPNNNDNNSSSTHFSRQRISFPPKTAAYVQNLEDMSARNARRARDELIEVQEQGFEFIRNLICGADSSEILDMLFTGVGQDRIYEILAAKLRSKVITRSPSTIPHHPGATTRILCKPSSKILVPVIYILVHIAATQPRHRHALIQQTDLLKSLIPLFGHESKDVRVGLAWLVINLTWKDDGTDEVSCRNRAVELRKLGFVSKLEGLLADPILDVKERAKTALYQLKLCFEGGA